MRGKGKWAEDDVWNEDDFSCCFLFAHQRGNSPQDFETIIDLKVLYLNAGPVEFFFEQWDSNSLELFQ